MYLLCKKYFLSRYKILVILLYFHSSLEQNVETFREVTDRIIFSRPESVGDNGSKTML